MTALELFNLQQKAPVFNNDSDSLRLTPPSNPGIYIVGNTLFNPYTNEEFYLVKVGMSKNIKERMKSYCTSNPLLFHIDYVETENVQMAAKFEIQCHAVLYSICSMICERSMEWVRVNKDVYIDICNQGYNYFENYLKNNNDLLV